MIKVLINNQSFEYFTQYTLNLKHNTVASTFTLYGLTDFLPTALTYPKIEIYREDKLIFTGFGLSQKTEIQAKPTLKNLSGYSMPGLLEDVCIPISMYPLQADNLSLREILDKIIPKFGIEWYPKGSQIASAIDKKFIKTIAEPGDTVKSYINNLASQRGILVTHNRFGHLILKKGEFVAASETIQNVITSALNINGQNMHSEITVIRQASAENPDSGQITIKNQYCKAFRPVTKILDSGDLFDVGEAAKNLLRAELSQIKLSLRAKDFYMPGYSIFYDTGEIDIMDWFIDETIIEGTPTGEVYTYNCVPNLVYQ